MCKEALLFFIVNGEEGFAASLKEALLFDKPAYEVQVARDRFSAGVLYARAKPDVVILVLNHPEVDGYEVCRQIKQDGANGDMLVLIISDRADGDGRKRILRLGTTRCLSKPVGMQRNLVPWCGSRWRIAPVLMRRPPELPGGAAARWSFQHPRVRWRNTSALVVLARVGAAVSEEALQLLRQFVS